MRKRLNCVLHAVNNIKPRISSINLPVRTGPPVGGRKFIAAKKKSAAVLPRRLNCERGLIRHFAARKHKSDDRDNGGNKRRGIISAGASRSIARLTPETWNLTNGSRHLRLKKRARRDLLHFVAGPYISCPACALLRYEFCLQWNIYR